MDVIEKKPVKKDIGKTDKSPEPPRLYQVFLEAHDGANSLHFCHVGILVRRFGLQGQAAFNAFSSALGGERVALLETPTSCDLAETKAMQANQDRNFHSVHNPYVYDFVYTAAPAHEA